MKNIMQMMQKAQNLQKDIENIQQEIKSKTFKGSAGGDLVTTTISGDYDIDSIMVDDSLMEDKEMMVDLIIASYNEAKRELKDYSKKRMEEVSNGLPLPAGIKLPGMN